MRKNSRTFIVGLYVLALAIFLSLGLGGDKIITVLSVIAPIKDRKVIVIDPGHGGEDGGAVSCTGIWESQLNLEIALKLNDLMNLLGYKTILTRATDISVHTAGNTIASRKVSDLKERVRIVNDADNAILISLHQNHFSDSRYYGAQVFFAPTEGSDELAAHMQKLLVNSINPGSKRQAKRADGIYLMQNIHCTGILVECGFLSNPQEEANLRSETYQKKLCCVIVSAINNYLAA